MAHYIDKDALVAEIERRLDDHKYEYKHSGDIYASVLIEELENILFFLNTLEAKEVDLEKEIDDWYNTMGIPVGTDALKETARYFFELGLKTQKGE